MDNRNHQYEAKGKHGDGGQYEAREAELLRGAGLRCTAPRVAVMGVLLGAKSPVSQEQIAVGLGGGSPNKVTIYRVLESFVNAGLVHKAFLQGRTQHFELGHNCSKQQCHPHFTCTDCGQTYCLTDMNLPMAKSPHRGFVVRRQMVQLEGICPQCSENQKASRARPTLHG